MTGPSPDPDLARDEMGFPCRLCLRGQGRYCCCATRCGAYICTGAPDA